MWQQWINVLLGLIVAIVPFLGMTVTTSTLTLAVAGLAIAGLGLWGVQATSTERESGKMIPRTGH